MPTKNLLVFIHGMMPEDYPPSAESIYNQLWDSVKNLSANLEYRIDSDDIIRVEWGRYDALIDRPDQNINKAEKFVAEKIHNKIHSDNPRLKNLDFVRNLLNFQIGSPLSQILQPYLHTLRQTIIYRGLGDVVYYCSEEGKLAVQVAVYGSVLKRLEYYREEPDTKIRLHIIAHSLGVTVANDFLHGLFSPAVRSCENEQENSDQLTLFTKKFNDPKLEPLRQKVKERYEFWRSPENKNRLELGSIVSMASQLPLLMLRSQHIVDDLADGKKLSPEEIGISEDTDEVIWKIFYDIDDLLAFPTSPLFGDHPAIKDCQVDSGAHPGTAHTDYWKTPKVHEEISELLNRRML